jgi:hypothetical protein
VAEARVSRKLVDFCAGKRKNKAPISFPWLDQLLTSNFTASTTRRRMVAVGTCRILPFDDSIFSIRAAQEVTIAVKGGNDPV